jgi:hypothetical protein
MHGVYERTPQSQYQLDNKALIARWDRILRSHGLPMHKGELDGHSYGGDVNEITEDELYSPTSNTVNRDVSKRNYSRKTVDNLTPPFAVDVNELLKRLDAISREIVRLRVVGEHTWKEISEAIGLCEKQVFSRYDAAIARMRLPECPPFSITARCQVCGNEMPLKKKGPLKQFCSSGCQAKRYRQLHGRSDRKPRIDLVDGGTF